MSVSLEALGVFCRCVTCARILTGKIDVGICKCKKLFCEVCLEKNQESTCKDCGVPCQRYPEVKKGAFTLFSGSQNYIRGYPGLLEAAWEQVSKLRSDFDYVLDAVVWRSPQGESQEVQFGGADQRRNSGHYPVNQGISQDFAYGRGQNQGNLEQHPASLNSSGNAGYLNRSRSRGDVPLEQSRSVAVPHTTLPSPAVHYVQPRPEDSKHQYVTESQEECKGESQEPMIVDPSFPIIPEGTNEGGTCVYCGDYIYPNSKGRCRTCNKVNYNKVLFNRDQFLSGKWTCSQCGFRNVHSNPTCINCNKRKGGGLNSSYRS